MKAVFDLDDTICIHKKRDFEKAKPILETINKIKKLKEDGFEIVIYTARGQNSCKGDIVLIKNKYEKDIITWLNNNGVPFDELIFGKPLGDVYVDDKGVSLEDFKNINLKKMNGNSGSKVYLFGDKVIKECNNSWEQSEWYNKAKEYGVNCPEVLSVVLKTITMKYIDGEEGYKISGIRQFNKILSHVFLFSKIKTENTFSVDKLIQRIDEHLSFCNADYKFPIVKKYLSERKTYLEENSSFYHGDLSLSNVIFKGDEVYFIDPNPIGEFSSYLMDLAKLKFSINNGEFYLNGADNSRFEEERRFYYELLRKNGLMGIISALEITHWIRLLKYARGSSKIEYILRVAKSLEGEL